MRASTFLGDNTVAIMGSVAEVVAQHLGVAVEFDAGAGRSSDDARANAGRSDVVWMCGHLTMSLLAHGLEAQIVAAPVFMGESLPVYRSVIVANRSGPATLAEALDGRVAINEIESWSGHRGLRSWLAVGGGRRWFASELISGSHRESIDRVAARDADVAGIDCTVWDHVVRSEPEAVAELHVIDVTGDWPAPPFVVSAALGEPLRSRLLEAVLAIGPGDVDGLDRIAAASTDDYRSMVG